MPVGRFSPYAYKLNPVAVEITPCAQASTVTIERDWNSMVKIVELSMGNASHLCSGILEVYVGDLNPSMCDSKHYSRTRFVRSFTVTPGLRVPRCGLAASEDDSIVGTRIHHDTPNGYASAPRVG
jgi:hypothetical protein